MNRLNLLSNLKKTIKKHPNKKSITIIRLLKKIYTKSKKQVNRRKTKKQVNRRKTKKQVKSAEKQKQRKEQKNTCDEEYQIYIIMYFIIYYVFLSKL